MKHSLKLILSIGLTMSLLNIVIAQTDTFCNNQTPKMYILPKAVVGNDALRIAMDSCISMSHKCQFYLDGSESEVVVRQIFGSDEFVINLCFVITTREEDNISYLVDLYSCTRTTPVSCRYKDELFIFCINDEDAGLLNNTTLLDTIIYKESIPSYHYTHIKDVDKVTSNSSNAIKGYVFLHLDRDGKWWLNTLNCVQVEGDKIIFEDEDKIIYYAPSDNTENVPSGFNLINID